MPAASAAFRTSSVVAVGPHVADVLFDGGVQQRRLLLDEHDVPADALERQRAEIVAVEANDAGVRIEQPRREIGDRRLADAAAADERDASARAAP